MFPLGKPKRRLPALTGALTGLLAGAGIMYLLDPISGRRRRARIRDRAVHVGNETSRKAGARTRDLRNRLSGVAAKARSTVSSDTLSDGALAERIRARMGRLIADPGAVEVSVEEGRVELLGRIPADDAERLVEAVGHMRGVRNVQSRLDIPVSGGDGTTP
jgi:osmotically-inducible protein OsmY